jgi:hypothetical protein
MPRFVPPKQFVTPRAKPKSPPTFAIDMTQSWEKAEVPTLTGFPTPHLDSPAKPRAPHDPSLELSPYPELVRKRAQPSETRIPKARPVQKDLPVPAPRGPSTSGQKMSFNFPTGSSSSNPQGEKSFFINDLSVDSKALLSRIGLGNVA